MNAISQFQALGLELAVIPPVYFSTDSDFVLGETFLSLSEHRAAVSKVQRFRGRVYVADGAIPAEALDEEGRHHQEFDLENYHLCLRDSAHQIRGCFRLRLHSRPADAGDLKLHDVIERMPPELATRCCRSLNSLLESSWREGVRIGEVGGWAIDEQLRQHRVSVLLALAAWSLYQILGNATVLAAATTRHHSSAILKRIGGFPLRHGNEPLPAFMDDFHGCEMELLGFDSRCPHPKYEKIVSDLKTFLMTKICPSAPQVNRHIQQVSYA